MIGPRALGLIGALLLAGCATDDIGGRYAADTLASATAALRSHLQLSGGNEPARTRAAVQSLRRTRLHSLSPCRVEIEFDYEFQGEAETGLAQVHSDPATDSWVIDNAFMMSRIHQAQDSAAGRSHAGRGRCGETPYASGSNAPLAGGRPPLSSLRLST